MQEDQSQYFLFTLYFELHANVGRPYKSADVQVPSHVWPEYDAPCRDSVMHIYPPLSRLTHDLR